MSGIDYLVIALLVFIFSCVSQVVTFICLGAYLEKKKEKKDREAEMDLAFMKLLQELDDCIEKEEEKDKDDKPTRIH